MALESWNGQAAPQHTQQKAGAVQASAGQLYASGELGRTRPDSRSGRSRAPRRCVCAGIGTAESARAFPTWLVKTASKGRSRRGENHCCDFLPSFKLTVKAEPEGRPLARRRPVVQRQDGRPYNRGVCE